MPTSRPRRQVAIVNETFARRYFDEPSAAVGQMLVAMSGRTGQDEPVQIVGVVGDVRHIGLDREPIAEIFRPFRQTFMFPMAMVVRTQGPPEQIGAAVRQLAFEIDPVVPVAEMQPYTTMIAGTLGRPRLVGFLLTIFAAAGLGLGLVGVYGVVAYRVRQREREIGIRLALGARPKEMATERRRAGRPARGGGHCDRPPGRVPAVARDGQHAVRRHHARSADVHGVAGPDRGRDDARLLPAGTAGRSRRSGAGDQAGLASAKVRTVSCTRCSTSANGDQVPQGHGTAPVGTVRTV